MNVTKSDKQPGDISRFIGLVLGVIFLVNGLLFLFGTSAIGKLEALFGVTLLLLGTLLIRLGFVRRANKDEDVNN